MTAEIQQEILERQSKTKTHPDVHGQEGAQPGTVAGAPTEEELRSTPDDLNASVISDTAA
jgi:hypothetical protein